MHTLFMLTLIVKLAYQGRSKITPAKDTAVGGDTFLSGLKECSDVKDEKISGYYNRRLDLHALLLLSSPWGLKQAGDRLLA